MKKYQLFIIKVLTFILLCVIIRHNQKGGYNNGENNSHNNGSGNSANGRTPERDPKQKQNLLQYQSKGGEERLQNHYRLKSEKPLYFRQDNHNGLTLSTNKGRQIVAFVALSF